MALPSILLVALLLVPALAFLSCDRANAAAVALPNPAFDAPLASAPGRETAVLAGGCFWGIQLVFQHVKGVLEATSGYSGGSAAQASYERVSMGTTGHAESVQVVYDPSQITYGQILRVFFSVAHDPTRRDRQGADVGAQYRSAIFYNGEGQKRIAESYIAQLNQAKLFPEPIVTQVVPLQEFYPAEDYHQNYATQHPSNPYIQFNDLPKLGQLRQFLPELCSEK